MNKKAIVITENGLITEVLELKTFTDELDFAKICKEAKENKAKLEAEKKAVEQWNQNALNETLKCLERKVHNQELEIKLLKGEIDESEYYERLIVLEGEEEHE